MDTHELENLRKPLAGDTPLSRFIDPLVREGEVYEKLPDGVVRCHACGHNCTIKPGGRGICQVRYNLGGKLYVPWGYVAALQCDPIEKKPFNHIYPGSDTITFGMLGCDLHCSYCFTGDTRVVTDQGPIALDEAFRAASRFERRPDGEIAYPGNLRAVTASGVWHPVKAVFKHPYRGQLTVIRPYYLPELRCTPDHRVYATDDPAHEPEKIEARYLSQKHYLAIPRNYGFSSPQIVDSLRELEQYQVTYRVTWDLSVAEREMIAAATARGETSRQIGDTLGIDPSYVRHVRGKIAHGRAQETRTRGPLVEGDRLRFPHERQPGIPLTIALDRETAQLLGYYCAEGSVTANKNRPNSLTLNFSLSKRESALAENICRLLQHCLRIRGTLVSRDTTLGVAVSKASVAHLFGALCGKKSHDKHVPPMLFDAERPVVEAFLQAVVEGDGHRYAGGKVSLTTVSPDLAYGVAWLALKLGYLSSIYDAPMGTEGIIQGRRVRRAPHQYTVVWYENAAIQRRVVETEKFYLVPLRGISFVNYEGDVYNMEVEGEHNYLAGFFLVSNCQNWDISQALRDSESGRPPEQITPETIVQLAIRNGARSITSSYNEPLITSEWAVAIFKQAKAAGLSCNYVSNGNATREVLEYIRPYTEGYKIDLKTMSDKNYRKLGAEMENVLDAIEMAHQMGFWVEIVTLVVPGFNDSEAELREAAQFIKSISPDIPWHVTAFHRDYRMRDPDNTNARALIHAAEIGYAEGLHYVYAGNVPGQVDKYEHTYCPNCHEVLIRRFGYVVLDYQITPEGTCPHCQTKIAGLWPKSKKDVRLGTVANLYSRVPRWVR